MKYCPDCGEKKMGGICPNCNEELFILESQIIFDGIDIDLSNEFVEKIKEQMKRKNETNNTNNNTN